MFSDILLPLPQKEGGMPLMEALSKRSSHRKCSPKKIGLQTLSNILWAGFGYNRENFRTAPSSHNRQETDLYVFLEEGTYLYDASANTLIQINDIDMRAMTGTQDFVASVPLNIAFVADLTKLEGKAPQDARETAYADTGFISQNIYLCCAQEGLNSVTRLLLDKEKLSGALSLHDGQIITLVHSIGYPPEK